MRLAEQAAVDCPTLREQSHILLRRRQDGILQCEESWSLQREGMAQSSSAPCWETHEANVNEMHSIDGRLITEKAEMKLNRFSIYA